MSNTNAVIVAAIVTAAGLRLAVVFEKNDPNGRGSSRVVIGALVLLLFLFLIAEFSPDTARGLALVILLTAVVMNGQPFFYMIRRMVLGEVKTFQRI